jgi:hypothetical protein
LSKKTQPIQLWCIANPKLGLSTMQLGLFR